MRAAGAPSGVTVATVMALASRGSLAWASANQRENSSKGSLFLLDVTSSLFAANHRPTGYFCHLPKSLRAVAGTC